MVSWSLLSAATALVTRPEALYVLRFLLDVAEAGCYPGIGFARQGGSEPLHSARRE